MAHNLEIGYRSKKNNDLLPSLTPGSTIPNNLRSTLADPNQQSRIGMGPVGAITKLLSGGAKAFREDNALRVFYISTGKTQERRNIHARDVGTTRVWSDAAGATGPYLIGLADSVIFGNLLPEVRNAHLVLTTRIGELGINVPTSDRNDWRTIDGDARARELVMHLNDALYYGIKDAHDQGRITSDGSVPIPDVTGRMLSDRDLGLMPVGKPTQAQPQATPEPTPQPTPRSKPVELTPLARLERLTNMGGTALLSGPTGTFKTETGKQLALATSARLISLKGAAGLEDRDFWGAIVPTEAGPKWVDGPLTRAFRTARQQKTVLLIDELLRFEPLYANVLVGALDMVNPAELKAMGLEPLEDGPHYCVTLPSGEVIAAPKRNLTIVATTNLGDDYAQFTELDSALLGRFELQIDMPEADVNVLQTIYRDAIGNTKIVNAVLKFEAWTRRSTGTHGGLLKRATNPRVTLNLLREAGRLKGAGMTVKAALENAFSVTVMPYCAPRDTTGALAEDACAVLRDEFRTVTRAV